MGDNLRRRSVYQKKIAATDLEKAVDKVCSVKKYSKSLHNMRKHLTEVIAVTVVIGLATCSFPAIAQAQRLRARFSGFSDVNSAVDVDFDLNYLVEDINNLESEGEFPRSVENFSTSGNQDTGFSSLSFDFGTVTSSRYTSDPALDPLFQPNFNFDGFGGLRYDVVFEDGPETLTLFIPSTDSSLINSLSGIIARSDVQGVVTYSDGRRAEIVRRNEPRRQAFSITTVSIPEPQAVTGLVGLGAIGAGSLLKRSKRLSKSA